jgi:hypothetical protein
MARGAAIRWNVPQVPLLQLVTLQYFADMEGFYPQ